MATKTGGLFADLRLNFFPSQLSYYLMRLTGVALVAYLLLHIWSLHGIVEMARTGDPQTGIAAWNRSVQAYDTHFGHVIEYLLLLAVVFHLLNGLRLVAVDWLELSQRQARLLWATVFGMVVVCAAAAPVFFPELFVGLG